MSTVFSNPVHQLQTMEQRILQELSQDVAEEIFDFARIRTEEKYNQIFNILIKRVNSIDEIYSTENKDKQQYLERMERFLKLTNPSHLAGELSRTLVFPEIETYYLEIQKFFSKTEYGKLFTRYNFDKQAFQALQAGILSDIHMINSSLKEYGDAVGEHVQVMKGIKDSTGAKTAFRIGTKVVGTLLAGPLGSIAGGALAKAITNDDNLIVESYGNVIDAWSRYLDKLDDFLENLKVRYEHILLTLIGGLFVRVSQDLRTFNVSISYLTLGKYGIEYSIEAKELLKYRKWVQETTEGILTKISEKQFTAAIKGSAELYSFIDQHKLLKVELYKENRSFLYVACLYRFAAIASYAKVHKDKLDVIYELFSNQTLLLNDDDLLALGMPTQLELAMVAVHAWIEKDSLKGKGTVLANLLLHSVERYNSIGHYEGEIPKSTFINFLIMISKHLAIEYEVDEYEMFIEGYGISPSQVRELMRQYKKITSTDKDEITRFAKVLIGSAWFWAVFRFFKKPAFIGSALAAILIISFVLTQDKWQSFINDIFKKEEIPVVETVQPVKTLTVEVDTANVRSLRSLLAEVITTVPRGSQFPILQQQTDAEGTVWYQIETSDGAEGWISSSIVSVEE